MVNVTDVFNSSLEVGQWLSASDTNLTGSITLSILVLLGLVLLVAAFLKMPQLLMIAIIFPLILVLTAITEFTQIGGMIVGIVILITAFGLMSIFPAK